MNNSISNSISQEDVNFLKHSLSVSMEDYILLSASYLLEFVQLTFEISDDFEGKTTTKLLKLKKKLECPFRLSDEEELIRQTGLESRDCQQGSVTGFRSCI